MQDGFHKAWLVPRASNNSLQRGLFPSGHKAEPHEAITVISQMAWTRLVKVRTLPQGHPGGMSGAGICLAFTMKSPGRVWQSMPVPPALGRQKWEVQEFKTSLDCVVSFNIAWYAWWDPISKKTRANLRFMIVWKPKRDPAKESSSFCELPKCSILIFKILLFYSFISFVYVGPRDQARLAVFPTEPISPT